MLIWSDGETRIPIARAIWHKEKKYYLGRTASGQSKYQHTERCLLKVNGQALPYKTKNTIGLELTSKVIDKGINPQYITFDSWYASKNNIKAFRLLGIHCYSTTIYHY